MLRNALRTAVLALAMTATCVIMAAPSQASTPGQGETVGFTYKWNHPGDCATGTCHQLSVTMAVTCTRGLFVQADELDKARRPLGTTNALIGPINQGETAVLSFPTLAAGATFARITAVKCLSM